MLKWTKFAVAAWVVLVLLGSAAVAVREWALLQEIGVPAGSR